MNRTTALRKLEHRLQNPDRRTIEENAPVIILKNGKHVMVETRHIGPNRYVVSLDFGLTCREIGRASDLSGVLDLILTEGN